MLQIREVCAQLFFLNFEAFWGVKKLSTNLSFLKCDYQKKSFSFGNAIFYYSQSVNHSIQGKIKLHHQKKMYFFRKCNFVYCSKVFMRNENLQKIKYEFQCQYIMSLLSKGFYSYQVLL